MELFEILFLIGMGIIIFLLAGIWNRMTYDDYGDDLLRANSYLDAISKQNKVINDNIENLIYLYKRS